MSMRFPVILVSGESIRSFRDMNAFQTMLALSTDKAIADGFFRHAIIIDNSLDTYRVRSIVLRGSTGVFAWMKRRREIANLEIDPSGRIALGELKNTLLNTIENSGSWLENEDVASLARDIRSANEVSALVPLF